MSKVKSLSHSVRAGEIIGYRVWEPIGNDLTSMAFHYCWPRKGKPAQAKNADFTNVFFYINTFQEFYDRIPYLNRLCVSGNHACDGTDVITCLYTGFHAWKTKELAEKYILEMSPQNSYRVFGTIWMWGDVIEHEQGYRCTHTAIRSIDRLVKIKRRGVWADILCIPSIILKDAKYAKHPKILKDAKYAKHPNSVYANTLEFYQKEYDPC